MTKQPTNTTDLIPLTEPTFYILLSLAQKNKHGYAILKDVEELSQGRVRLSTGTLYEGLARLLDQRLIERVMDEEPVGDDTRRLPRRPGKPRKSYRLTRAGRQVLEEETERLRSLISAAKRRLGEEGV